MGQQLRDKKIYKEHRETKIISCEECKQTTVVDLITQVYTFTDFSKYHGHDVELTGSNYYRIDDDIRVKIDIPYIPNCPRCGAKRPKNRTLKAKVSTKHVCGNDCQSATGDSCSCSCGGLNHGANHRLTERFPTYSLVKKG